MTCTRIGEKKLQFLDNVNNNFENENYHRFIISLQTNNLTSLSSHATDLTSDR
jgi:hypothetical protein